MLARKGSSLTGTAKWTVYQRFLRSNTHTHVTALCPGLPEWASTRKVKPVSILLDQETVSGSGISWAICKSAPRSRQITMPASHHSVFYRLDALPAAQPTATKHIPVALEQADVITRTAAALCVCLSVCTDWPWWAAVTALQLAGRLWPCQVLCQHGPRPLLSGLIWCTALVCIMLSL